MAAPPPRLPDEIVEEILLRLPADDPACLLRASLVCKTWNCAVSSPGFRRRLHERHRTPPVLGFLHNGDNEKIPRFIPSTASSFSLAAPDRRSWFVLFFFFAVCSWFVLDCRHGRALFWTKDTNELLVWEPITGAQRRIPMPPSSAWHRWPPNATVFCAAGGCKHRDCHGGPFHLVYVSVDKEDTDSDAEDDHYQYDQYHYVTSACLYSSETDTWGELTSMHRAFYINSIYAPSLLVGRSLLYFISDECRILEYDLARHGLTLLDPPELKHNYYDYHGCRFYLMLADDGGLGLCQAVMLEEDGGTGFSQAVDPHLKLWSRKASDGTNAQWIVSQVIYLENLLPHGALVNAASSLHVHGFAEGANVIFVVTAVGLFTIELHSHRVRKVCDHRLFKNLIPVVSFYTPMSFDMHQYSPTVACYGKVAPEGCALLTQPQEVIDPSSDVSKSAQ